MTAKEFEFKIENRYVCSTCTYETDNNIILNDLIIPALVQIMKNQEKILENQRTLGNRIVNIEDKILNYDR